MNGAIVHRQWPMRVIHHWALYHRSVVIGRPQESTKNDWVQAQSCFLVKKMKQKAVSAQCPTYYFLNKPAQLQDARLHWCKLCFLFCGPLSGCFVHSWRFYLQFLSVAAHGYVADMWHGDRAPFKYSTGMYVGCDGDRFLGRGRSVGQGNSE